MGFLVKSGNRYVKRTCTRYGPFYGSLVTTERREEARVWTRRKDAENMVGTIQYHASLADKYPTHKYRHRARDFAPNIEVIEE